MSDAKLISAEFHENESSNKIRMCCIFLSCEIWNSYKYIHDITFRYLTAYLAWNITYSIFWLFSMAIHSVYKTIGNSNKSNLQVNKTISNDEKMNLKAHIHHLVEWSKLSQLHNMKEEICRQFKISCPNKKKTRNISITFDIISHVNTRRFFRSFFLYLCRCSHCPQAFRYNNNLWTLFQWCFCMKILL